MLLFLLLIFLGVLLPRVRYWTFHNDSLVATYLFTVAAAFARRLSYALIM